MFSQKALTSQLLLKLPNKDIIANIENAVKDLEKEGADMICAKVSLTIQNSKLPKDTLSIDECKALKEL